MRLQSIPNAVFKSSLTNFVTTSQLLIHLNCPKHLRKPSAGVNGLFSAAHYNLICNREITIVNISGRGPWDTGKWDVTNATVEGVTKRPRLLSNCRVKHQRSESISFVLNNHQEGLASGQPYMRRTCKFRKKCRFKGFGKFTNKTDDFPHKTGYEVMISEQVRGIFLKYIL